jgi:hypothetical protein
LRQQLAILEQQSRELKAADAKIEKEIRARTAITPPMASEGAEAESAGPHSARVRNSRAQRPDELHRASTQPNLMSEHEVQAARAALMHREDHSSADEEAKSSHDQHEHGAVGFAGVI